MQCDQAIALNGFYASKHYPQHLRRVRYFDAVNNKRLVFLTNNFELPALTIAELYRCRWQVELFFKWIKQHLRIKKFYGFCRRFQATCPKMKPTTFVTNCCYSTNVGAAVSRFLNSERQLGHSPSMRFRS